MDTLTPEQRSERMGRVRNKDTKPELKVRRLLHRMGYRFRLHAKDLKGKPDVVFRKRRAVVFVHGCYWHGHDCRVAGKPAQSNTAYWRPKIQRTRDRDEATRATLEAQGWRVLVIRECEATDLEATGARLLEFLGPPRAG
jgi:DNA mismatch endonuclease (patch repair protein)